MTQPAPTTRRRRLRRLAQLGTVLGFAVALWSAALLVDRVRAVDIVALFAGGFGAGAGLTALLVERRDANREGGPRAPFGSNENQADG